jgi:LPS sulfotransferase NodH
LSYLICATPRSGSNYLCEVLRSTGNAGHPDDYFWNPPYWWERWGTSDFPSYVRRILEEGTTPNGVFGSKMMWDYLGDLLPQLAALFDVEDAAPADVLKAAFPDLRYIWLTRRDKVRQGISYYLAMETGIWRSTDAAKGPTTDPPFNFLAIDRMVELSTWEDEAWQGYFQQYGLQPLDVAYEDLARAPMEVARHILANLGLPSGHWPERSWQHRRQANARTDAWVERYHALKGTPSD